MQEKIDSNSTGLAIAEEVSLKVLPITPVWREQEPNSYSDFGSEITTVARTPIKANRQNQKGVITDLSASGGFNTDYIQELVRWLAQGFFFADAREKFGTQKLNSTAIPIMAVTGNTFTAANGLNGFLAGQLVKTSGFSNAANNGIRKVVTAVAGTLTVSETNVAEASPPSTAKIEAVGFQAASGDINLAVTAGVAALTSTVLNFTTLGLVVGEWLFIGGDSAETKFVNNAPGFARIKSITASALTLENTAWIPVAETGTGLAIQLFFGTVIKNENTVDLIKRRSYHLERQLGKDDIGTQAEYIVGAIPNELTFNFPQADKLNLDVGFVAMDAIYRTGAQGLLPGTRVAAPREDVFNTSSDLALVKLYYYDPTTGLPTELFAHISEAKVSLNNNVSPNKALATLGAFEASAGTFSISGTLTAYFTEVAAVKAVRQNYDCGLTMAGVHAGAGFVLDIPLLSLGGGKVTVEKDSPIMIPLEQNGAECPAGYTMMLCFHGYLPEVATA